MPTVDDADRCTHLEFDDAEFVRCPNPATPESLENPMSPALCEPHLAELYGPTETDEGESTE